MTERDIFLAALEIAGSAERAAYVARACGDDQALRNQVEELLRTHDETSQFLETPAAATNAVADRTVIGDSSTEDDDDDGPPSSEAEFAKYLEPATRPGWIGRLGHYEIEQILGRGAFGIVAKAFDDKLHRVVAIKFMNPTLAATSPPRKRFLREARTAAAVTHENIVAIYAVEEEPIPYLVMEYIPGQTLQQRMDANGPFDVPEILKLGRQIASGLAAAHAANLIHRDIKPANILLTGGTNERAKISDFGLARAVDDASLTSSGLIAGTPMYMSPEQARGETLDHRTDLFSLGSVLYQMASGRPPFRAANTIAVLKRVCEDRPRPLDDVISGAPEWLQTIIFRLMEKDPGNRFQSADEVTELLERYETELRHHGRVKSVFTVPETLVLKRDTSPSAAPRKMPLAWLIAGVTALVLIVGFVVMNGGKTPPEPIPIVSQRTPPTAPSEQAAITWKPTPEQQSFFEEVAGLTLVGQVKAVEKKLSEENPGFLGTGNVSFDDGKVSTLNISGNRISDLWPVRAFPGLTSLICNGTQGSAPKLQDLSSLVGIKLTNLSFANTSVSDLSPLAGMPLERLECFSTKVSDLGPLSGMPLTYLNIANTSVSNLAPLSGSPLSYFSCSNTRVDDLAPLAGAPLTTCHLRLSRVTDLSPLEGAPLTTLTCNEELIASHRDLLRGIKTLETINGRPAKEWLDESSYGWPADAPAPAIAPFDAEQAKKHQEEWAAYLGVPVEYENSIGMKFRLIPPGEFLMGSTPEEVAAALADVPSDETNWRECIQSEAPKHRVILTQAFYLGTNEVTQSEYASVVGAKPSHFAESGAGREAIAGMDTSRHPVETVSWIDASEFCAKLCQSDKLKPYDFPSGGTGSRTNGTGYRLPTEAEWEFACRAGTITRFWSGESEYDLAETAWFQDNSGWKTHEVATLKENPLGLYDMHGNVWEWVLDDWEPSFYRQFAVEPAIDPLSRGGKRSQKIVRGGPKSSGAVACRCANRNAAAPMLEGNSIGFRVALSVESVKGLLTKGDLTKTTASPSNWHGWPVDAPRPAIAPFNTEQGMQHQQAWAEYLGVPVEYENSIGMKFRLIPPGEFLMGSTPEEIEAALPIAGDDQTWQDCIRSEGPLHQVILTQPFFLGTNEVTQSQFQLITETNPSRFAASGEWADSVKDLDTAGFPVESVAWASARDFCQQLAKREGLQPTASNTNGLRLPFGTDPYRLPAEAEWEFACRAGSATQFFSGQTPADLSKVGWFDDNSSERTHATGELPANAFGLHDMHGNVWEWVLDAWQADRYAARAEKRAIDPFDPMTKDSEPLTRGGNWSSYAEACRSASRCSASSAYSSTLIGFRVAMSVAAVKGLVAKKQSDMAKLALRTFPNWPADAPSPAIAPFDAEQAKKHQEEWAAYLKVPVEYTNSIGMKFRLIPPGEFLMGGTPEEIAAALGADLTPFNGDFNWWSACLRSEGPRHRVRLTRPFYLGAHEVTQQQYQEIIGENPSENSPSGSNRERVAGLETANFPVEFLSWHDAVQFCNRLNEREQRTNRHLATMPPTLSETGTGYRLPTEAEWEFACRAGTTTRYWTGHDVDSVLKAGWFQVNDGGRTHAVGELLANPFGLFDVHGNAWEWTVDGWDESWYQQFADKLAVDPVCPLTDQPVAMMKTGTWPAFEHFCRAASRIPWPCDARNSLQGMRVTLSVEAVQEVVNAAAASMPDAE